MRISDWSSDVCSSDLPGGARPPAVPPPRADRDNVTLPSLKEEAMTYPMAIVVAAALFASAVFASSHGAARPDEDDRKSVVEGTSVSVRVELGGRRIIKKKTTKTQ